MTVLVITPDIEARAMEIRGYAEAMEHRITDASSPGDSTSHTLEIPTGFRAVYSVDAGVEEGVWFRHLSVSVASPDDQWVPSPQAMHAIAALFGFTHEARYGTLPPDPQHVIHALEIFLEN